MIFLIGSRPDRGSGEVTMLLRLYLDRRPHYCQDMQPGGARGSAPGPGLRLGESRIISENRL